MLGAAAMFAVVLCTLHLTSLGGATPLSYTREADNGEGLSAWKYEESIVKDVVAHISSELEAMVQQGIIIYAYESIIHIVMMQDTQRSTKVHTTFPRSAACFMHIIINIA